MHILEEYARRQAHRVAFEKQASLWNVGTVGGAVLGGGYGALQGAKRSREGESNLGAIGGGVVGALSGALAGGSARALVKKVPEGWKSWGEGKKALEKEYMTLNKIKEKPASGDAAKTFKDNFNSWRETRGTEMRKAEDLASAGKRGKEARDAIDAVRKSKGYENLGKAQAGKEQFYGSLFGGGLGLGFGGYQLMNAGNINEADDQEKRLQAYVDLKEGRVKQSSYEAMDHVGRLLARTGW